MGKRCYPWVFLGIKNNIQSNRMLERLIDRFDKKIYGGVITMDVRKKLVELLDIIIQPGQITLGDIADHLIRNGVTVQEWISVNDRLPEAGGYVVCIAKRNPFSRFMPMVARIEKHGWANPITEQYISEVTHWMPMTEPPEM